MPCKPVFVFSVCGKEGMDGEDEDTLVNFKRVGCKERQRLAETNGCVLRAFALESTVAAVGSL